MNIDMVERATDAYLADAGGSAAERLRFLKGLWLIQSEVETASTAPYVPDAERARAAIVSGKPLFLSEPPAVPLAEYVAAVARIAAYVADAAALPPEMAEAVRNAGFAAAITPERLEGAAAGQDAFVSSVAEGLGATADGPLSTATVAFVLLSALTPFLTGPAASAVAALGETGPQAWISGTCPVCGASAALGRMGERTERQGGQRTLWCARCHTEWGYERLRCARCGTADPVALRYAYIEDDPVHRLHLCDECHGYLKVVFEDDLSKPLSLLVEDAASTAMDVVARSEGYSPDGSPRD